MKVTGSDYYDGSGHCKITVIGTFEEIARIRHLVHISETPKSRPARKTTQERILKIKKFSGDSTPGRILSRGFLQHESGVGWSLSVGGLCQPKTHYSGRTIDDVLSLAEEDLGIIPPNTERRDPERVADTPFSHYARVAKKSEK